MARFLKLTDGRVFAAGLEEYVEVDQISRIETHQRKEYVAKAEKRKVSLFKRKDVTVDKTYTYDGAIVFMKNKGKTYVKESPSQIIEMIKNKQFVEV